MSHLSDRQFRSLSELFRLVSGNRLSDDKKAMVEARLSRRLYKLGLDSFDKYLFVLRKFPKQEIPHLISLLTTHHTHFFREKAHFDYLTQEILSANVKRSKFDMFRIWCAASSTGEEPYTLAMLLDGYFKEKGLAPNFEIFATDIDGIAVETGKRGLYSMEVISSIPSRYQLANVSKNVGSDHRQFKIRQELLERIKWNTHNLKDENYEISFPYKFDAVFVRNVFIYFDPIEVEHAVCQLARFLKPEGTLFLGLSESIQQLKTPFTLVQPAVYRLNEGAASGTSTGSSTESTVSKGNVPSTAGTKASSNSKPPIVAQASAQVSAGASPGQKIRVLVVDDSKTIHILLKSIISSAPDMEIVGQAYDGQEALHFLKMKKVDVITSDIHMPNMDGIALLEAQMKTYAIPTIMISSISKEDGMQFLHASELGAVDYVEKPKQDTLESLGKQILEKIRVASTAKPTSALAIGLPAAKVGKSTKSAERLILIGASTGGPDAIGHVLRQMHKDCPPILIVQHMPAVITKAFAERLSTVCAPEVKEAYDNDFVLPGHIYIAPGDKHLGIKDFSGKLKVVLSEAPPIGQHRPAADFLFRSALPLTKKYSIVAALLTGMGRDGAEAMKLLHDAGVKTIAQDKESSVVYGMARAAVELKAVDVVCPLSKVAQKIFDAFEPANKAKAS